MPGITNEDDIISSGDVIARIEELRDQRDDEGDEGLNEDEVEELANLESLAEQGEEYAQDWTYGNATLVRDTYFVTYAQTYAEDMREGDFEEWPLNHIDWDAAADALRVDYNSISYAGETYFVR